MPDVSKSLPKRKDDRIIIHFDYDCFYASVFEAENPALKSVPLAVQQKQIIVTCNYEARRRGLRKLQLITEARKVCPEVVIVLGEQLDRFRNASKMLYQYLEGFTWNRKVERLGFDEVFMDVTDIVTYNQALINPNDLSHSFFQLSREDPTVGFSFDATKISGYSYPEDSSQKPFSVPNYGSSYPNSDLLFRLILGSHLAAHLRLRLEEEKGYTSTVGISTSKLLSKLVGNLHKPKAQTTILPPYDVVDESLSGMNDGIASSSNVTAFIDSHDIGKIPGIGFKMAHKIRCHVLSRPAEFDAGLIYGGTLEDVKVRNVRVYPGMGSELLESLLGGPGAERGIGGKVWSLINGIDDTEVQQAKKVPSQISIEDSYIRLDTIAQVGKELRMLATSLVRRMHIDLLEVEEGENDPAVTAKRWMAHPKTIRLSTRPRRLANANGSQRSFNRISRSAPLPNFIFNLREGVDAIVEKLVQETLIPMFHRLHPEPSGWNLSLVNIGVTNMLEAASEDGSTGEGRDIGRMFKRQETVLKDWKVEDKDVPPDGIGVDAHTHETQAEPSAGVEAISVPQEGFDDTEDIVILTQTTGDEYNGLQWEEEDEEERSDRCSTCGAMMPPFAVAAHERFHALGDR